MHPIFWPVLWFSLARLWAVLVVAGLEGREQVLYFVNPDGTIDVAWRSDTPQEIAARHPLGQDFDFSPWLRLAPLDFGQLAALFSAFARDTAVIPSRHHGDTLTTPPEHHVLAPP